MLANDHGVGLTIISVSQGLQGSVVNLGTHLTYDLTAPNFFADSRYKKIPANLGAIEDFLVEAFVRQHLLPPARIVLDLDATDSPLHGHQLGRFVHGYYDEYCYLPLYIFCGDHPLCARLRPADIDGAAGALKQVQRIVAHLRRHWPNVTIVLRGDSGFCREHLMRWCEDNGVHYIFGLAKNGRLLRILGGELHQAQQQFEQTQQPARVFKDFTYRGGLAGRPSADGAGGRDPAAAGDRGTGPPVGRGEPCGVTGPWQSGWAIMV